MNTNRILFIAPELPFGGAEKFLSVLINNLPIEAERKLLVSLGNRNPLLQEIDNNIEFICYTRRYKFDLLPLLRLRKLIRKERPSLIFCLNFFSYFFFRCATIGFKKSSKRIISYHSTIHLIKKDHFLHKLYTLILTKEDRIITVSNNQAKYTAKRYNISEKFFKTIHNGIDTRHWKLPDPAWNRSVFLMQYDIPESAKVIIMTAALRHEKNHIGAVRALKILHQTFNSNVYLLLVGDGAMKPQIINTVKECELQEYVKFTGTQKDVRPFYWSSNISTLCSNSETFSIATLEAMSCGLPCVLTNVGGASEMICEEINGYLCDLNPKAIAMGWQKAFQTIFCPNKIHQHVKDHFSVDKMISEYQKLLL